MEEEHWAARRGHLTVVSRMRTIDRAPRRRTETVSMSFVVYTPKSTFRLVDQVDFRTYTASQLSRLFRRVPSLEPVCTFDFAYRIDRPIRVGPETEDVVYILRKK
jgi:hypothetical protein